MQTLVELNAKYPNCDKCGTAATAIHSYDLVYEPLFAPRRATVTKLLEVGVRFGHSLQLWADYFPNAQVHGVDNGEEEGLWTSNSDRIQVHYGDSCIPGTLKTIGDLHGPFDVIVDDGCHTPIVQAATFAALSPFLTADGLYIIEDVEGIEFARSLQKFFGGRIFDLRTSKLRHDDILLIFGDSDAVVA